MTVLDFFTSPIGLGHATRDVAIAKNLTGVRPRFITGGVATQFLENSGFEVVDAYRPTEFAVEYGTLKKTARWLWNYYKYYKECKKISAKIIESNKPDVIISDEDFASLAIAQKIKIPTVLITDILETRFTRGAASFVEKKMNRSMMGMVKKCNTVIIPEIGEDSGNIKRVGPIVRQIDTSRSELRKRYSFDKDIVLVTVGGTNAGTFLIEHILEAFSKIKCDADLVLVSGPSIGKKFNSHIRNMGTVNNLHEVIFASDVVVSLAGRSTIDETNSYGTPGIFIPIRGHFEQEDNAKREGFTFGDINRLDELIPEKLGEKRGPISCGGANTASKIIRDIIKSNP